MSPAPAPLPPVSALPGLPLDQAQWDAMLQTAGPQDAGWLVRQIVVDLNRMRDGLRAALDQGDAVALGRISHALAGLGGTIGAPPLHDAAKRLSDAAKGADATAVTAWGDRVQDCLAVLLAHVTRRLQTLSAP